MLRALPLYAPKSGLRVSAGQIDGSILGRMRLHDVALADPRGVFARVPVADLDWRPFDLLDRRLTVRTAHAASATLLRRPALRPSGDPRILPDIDIVVGRFGVDRLVLAPTVVGTARTVGVSGTVDSRDGRALVDLAATAASGGDTIRARLDAEPTRDRFDLDARVTAPAGGIIARLLGLAAPLDLRVGGDGSWRDWRGTAVARLGPATLADLTLTARAGRFVVAGITAPAPLLGGAAARLTAPAMRIQLAATIAERVVATDFTAAGPALRFSGAGRLDFAAERIEALTVDARLLRSAAFNPRLVARDMRLALRAGGSFARPQIDYALTAPAFSWGRTGFEVARATGRVDAGSRPLVIPVVFTAARLTNVGAEIAPLVAGLRVAGPLTLVRGQLASNTLAFRSARLGGTAQLRLDTRGGAWTVDLDGRLPGYRVGTIGIADVTARLHAEPDASGAGTRVTGPVRVVGRRIDSGFFRAVLGGLPLVTTRVDVAPDLSMRFDGARLVAPDLTLSGNGTRTPDGIVRLRGGGVSRTYGPVTVDLAGPIARPVTDVVLARPGFGIGLAGVAVAVAPVADGWSIAARGGSYAGPATLRGLARIGAATTLDLVADLAGITARGTLVPSEAGPFAGRLALTGPGVTGSALLTPAGTRQRAEIALAADRARLKTPAAPVTIARGTLAATLLLGGDVPSVDGRFTLADLRAPGLTLAAANGTIASDAGRGTLTLAARGTAGAPFDASTRATFDADRIEVGASATVAGKRLALDHPARLDRGNDGWTLTPVTLLTPDGRAEIAGRIGDETTVSARLDALGLSLLDVVDPTAHFGGRASGTIAATIPATGAPTGTMSLRVAGLTRAGVATTSLPVDLAVNAALASASASARAVIARGGATLGRAQAELTLAPGATLADRLRAAPLFAQARFAGPAQALWLLGGVESIDVRGPVAAAIDVGGRLGDPVLGGTLTATGARVENTALGTIVDNVRLDSRFAGSRLELTRFAGTIGGTGKVAGSGTIDLSAERAFPIDIRLDLDDARILDRDDLRATVSGGLRLQSSGGVGRISGTLAVSRARFRLGRGGATDVPVLAVTERNVELLGRPAPRTARPTQWRLDVAANARDDLVVTGLGLDSVWRGNLRIGGRATAPELTGRVRVVRGDYDFAGKRFTLTRGDIRFAGTLDPVIDITAENTSSGFTALLSLTGTASRPDIKFGSVPALPEDEVLARVLFGASITTLSAPEAVQLAGALASLRGGGTSVLNPIDAVRRGLRIDRLRILPADVATGRKTSIAAGQYIGRRLYVELSTDAQGYSASAIEVALTRSLSILSDVATLGGTSVNLRLKKDY